MFGFGKGAILDYYHPKCQLLSPESVALEDPNIKKIVNGNFNSYVLLSDGTLHEYLLDTEESSKVVKREVLKAVKIVNVFAGGDHAFAIDEQSIIYAWGSNSQGQLGLLKDVNTIQVPTQLDIFTTKKVVHVACGQSHSLILLKYGEVYSVGDNKHGQLGLRNKRPVTEPTIIDSFEGLPVILLAAGGWHSFCVTISGRVFSWGKNDHGQLGVGDFVGHASPKLMELSTEDPVAYISAGDNHSAILTRKGEMLTFGLNSSGQLGHGDSNNTSVPKPVEEFKGSVVTQIACGNNNTVAFVPGCGQVFTFGNCEHGQLGLGKLVEKVQTPEIVNGSWSSKHEEAIVSVFRICSAGNQTYILTSNIPDSSPSDFRAIGDEVGVVKFEKVFCSTLENVKDETDIISVINSKSCWNSSFADLNQVTNHYHHGVHLDQASEVLKLICGCKFSETIMKYLFEMLRSLDTDPPDLDAIRLYITLPMVFEHMEDSVQKLEMIRFFFIKLSHMEKVVWKVLERWYKSSEVAFVNIVHLGKALMLDNLRYLFLTGGDAGLRCQNVMKILNSHNEISKITSYKAFHLSLTEQFIKSNLEVVRILLLKYPFLGDAKSKATLLLLDAKNRKNKANFRERIDIMFGQFLPFLGLPPKIRISVNRSSLVADSVQQLQNVENLSRPFHVQFQGEEGIDDGAINKEYFMLILPELLTNYELFSGNDDSNYLWFSTSYIDAKEPLYNLVGKLCGIALCNNTVVNANFPLVLYKKLLGQEPDLDDFKEFEPTFGNSLQQILDFEEQEDQTVEEVFELTLVSSKGVPLKPNGHEIPVTSVNRDEYVRLCVNYVVNKSVEKQFSSFQNGFSKACSGEIFDIFRPEELMEMVVGKQDFSWEEVKASMDAFSVSDEFSEVCEWFWEVLLSFNDEEKEQFLIFLTASNKVPVSGFKFEIQQIEANDKLLPIAMTCYNILQLPVYSSKVVLEDRLNLAIQCKGFHLK